MEDIIFSKSVKAGKRIYYLDVKKNRKEELFLTITESKKVVVGEGEDAQVSFEKHKIFLYNEDFDKFLSALQETLRVATAAGKGNNGESDDASDGKEPEDIIPDKPDEIKIDIDFE